MKVRECKRDPPMAEQDETLHRIFDGPFEIGIDPRVSRRGLRPSERDKRPAHFLQIVDPRIGALRVCDDQGVSDAALGHPSQRAQAILPAALQEDREIETMFTEFSLQAVKHREKDRVDQRVIRAARNDHGDEIGFPQAKAASGLIGGIAELCRRFADALACHWIDVASIIQRARHRADRNVEMACEVANSDQGVAQS